MKALRQRRLRELPVLGETVQDAADPLGALLGQQPQGIGAGLAVMHDERLAGLERRADMGAEALALPFSGYPCASNSRARSRRWR